MPENRLHGVIAGKLYTYASDARVRRWPNGIEITGKREHQHDQHTSQRRTRADRIREAHRRPRQRDHRRRTRHRPPRIRAPVDWPSMAELHACFHLSQRRQAARDDAVFNELIARLDEEDDDSDG